VVIIKHLKTAFYELISRTHATKLAGRGRIRVGQVAARKRHVQIHVLAASLSRRRHYSDKLDRRTSNLLSSDGWELTVRILTEPYEVLASEPWPNKASIIYVCGERRFLKKRRWVEEKEWLYHLHPLPPPQRIIWLQDSIAVCVGHLSANANDHRRSDDTCQRTTKENRNAKMRPATSAVGAIDATALDEVSATCCGPWDTTNHSRRGEIHREHNSQHKVGVARPRGVKANSPVPTKKEDGESKYIPW
jgi:hypothetical protein